MDREQRKRLSKFLSLVLRHKPEKIGIALDPKGFCNISELIAKINQKTGFQVTKEQLEDLARPTGNPQDKVRFEIEGDRIRAGHGHSIAIDMYEEVIPSGPLFHGTPDFAVPSIQEDGLQPMARDKVHLSYDKAITIEAARRRHKSVTLVEVNVELAMREGVVFYSSADPRIVLSDAIPPQCLVFHS